MEADDLATGGFGTPWGHKRSFAGRLGYNFDLGQGYNWQVAQWPMLMPQPGEAMAVFGKANSLLFFDGSRAGGYSPRLGGTSQLSYDAENQLYRFIDSSGGITEFDGNTRVFHRHFDPAGNVTQVVSRGPGGELPGEVQRMATDAKGNTTVESYLYAYVQGSDYVYRVTSVTLRRQVNGGAWQNVRQALYTYYDGSTAFGWLGDLRTVNVQTWENEAWADLGATLYRYWLPPGAGSSGSSCSSCSCSSCSSGSASGSPTPNDDLWPSVWERAHTLKYIVHADSYARLAADPAAGGDPTLAPDAVVARYADNYFEYDAKNRVTLESVEGGSRTYTYAYEFSGATGDFNAWASKTTETLPDGTRNITFANYVGQVMLSVKLPAAGQGQGPWYDYFRYDSSGRLVLKAESSAIMGYDESYADLLNCQAASSSVPPLRVAVARRSAPATCNTWPTTPG